MSSTLLVCPELVTWRAIASGMLPPDAPAALLHLRDCPRCQSQARQALGRRDPLAYLVDNLSATADPDLQQALAQLRSTNVADSPDLPAVPGAVATTMPRSSRMEVWIISLAATLVLAGIIALVFFQSG